MFNSITKKMIWMQVVVVTIAMVIFIGYINGYIDKHINKEIRSNLNSNINQMLLTVDAYNKALENNALKLFNVFKKDFDNFYLYPERRMDVNGVKTPLLISNGSPVNNNFRIVNKFLELTGNVATVFAKDGDDFVRISTSLLKEDGTMAMGTYLGGSKSPAYEYIIKKNIYRKCHAVWKRLCYSLLSDIRQRTKCHRYTFYRI